jgi:trehalose 6-phosphate synthase
MNATTGAGRNAVGGVETNATGTKGSSTGPGDDRPRQHDLVVVANRLPVQCVEGEWRTSPGGLVRAMLGVARSHSGAWVGWPGDTSQPSDAESIIAEEAIPHVPHDPGCADLSESGVRPVEGVDLIPVPLSADEFHHYYERVSNGALWPLYHDAIRPSVFDAASWNVYREVNQRFAEAASNTVTAGGTVWVHDYHLHLVPEMVRALRPDVKIGFFLHIPFPPQELFMRLPWREEIIRGLLGADVVGFQRRVAAENFVSLAHRLVGTGIVETDSVAVGVQTDDGRVVHVGAFPISIDVDEIEEIAARPASAARATQLRECLGDPEAILLGVDRLDYTKGIDVRLTGFASLLESRRTGGDRNGRPPMVLVQIAVPGREGLDDYVEERRKIEQLVGSINGDHAALGFPAVHYLRTSLALEELVPLYMAADVMLVTPLRDGMNLVAKEFVAARTDKRGVLVLSEFAGASDELSDAILVNPHDPEAVVEAMTTALSLEPGEINARMTLLRKAVAGSNVHDWAESFLRSLAGEPPQGSLGE